MQTIAVIQAVSAKNFPIVVSENIDSLLVIPMIMSAKMKIT